MGFVSGVGREAPGFTLTAQDGNVVTLKDYRGEWLPLVIFYDPARPGAAARLSALSAAADRFWGLRGQLLALSSASAVEQRSLAAEISGLAFPLLVDEGSRVARSFGAFDRKLDRPVEATYIVDRSGKIVWVGEGDEAFRPAALLTALRSVAR